MCLSALSFSLMQMAVKFTSANVPVYEQVFFRNFIMLIISVIALKIQKKPFLRDKSNLLKLFNRGFFGMLGVVLYFYATKYLPSADAAILQKSSPFFVAIFAFFLMKERLTKVEIVAFIIAFAGTIIVTKPGIQGINLPSLSGLLSAMFAAVAYVIIAMLKNKEDSFTIMLSFSLVTSIFMLPFVIKNPYLPNYIEWMGLIAIGIFGALGQYFITLSYSMANAGKVSIFNYTSVIFSAILGYIFFGDTIDYISLIGIIFVFFAAYLVYNEKMSS